MNRKLRRSLLTLLVLSIVSMAVFAAGEIGMNGAVVWTFKYDSTTEKLTAWNNLNLNTTIKGTPIRLVLGDDSVGNWRTINLWDAYTNLTANAYTFRPYRIGVDINAAWFKSGPRVLTTLGDFNSSLPDYVSGHYNRNLYAGIKVANVPVIDKVTALAFFGWPKYGDGHTIAGKDRDRFFTSGTQFELNGLIPGWNLKAYGIFHQHKVPVVAVKIDGKDEIVNVGGTRGTDMLVVFLPGMKTGTNEYGYEVEVDLETGKVSEIVAGEIGNVIPKDEAVAAGKAVLSGHGTMATFLRGFSVDDSLSISYVEGKTYLGDATAGVEADGAVAGVNLSAKALTNVKIQDTGDVSFKEFDFATRVNADYTFAIDPVEVKLAGGFRYIDDNFAPFARAVHAADAIRLFDSYRNQLGGNAAVTLTLPAKTTVDLTGDYYQKIEAVNPWERVTSTLALTNSYFFNVTAKASATHTRSVEETPFSMIIADSVTTAASLARDWKLPNRDVVNTTYSFATSDVLKDNITFTNKLVAKGTLTVPYIDKVTLEGTGTLQTSAGTTTPSVEGKLNYTFANNVALEAKITKIGKNDPAWYIQGKYTVSF